ncbi:ATP-binding protein [Hydrogenophaga sp.]|uniref:ATP-binding protein n=1 Tax=Hydrogenophaga sp. TaxID=1904254 RepID=UPI0025BF2D6E|nr:ATP-binding protein [Hydrogenophaga sp.]
MKRSSGLVRQHAILIASAFIAIELLTLLAFAGLVMLPLARRSADDLAGLMVLSAQTWAELPPQTRPAFEHELQANHTLLIQPTLEGKSVAEWHAPFFYLLESALAKRVGSTQHLIRRPDAQGEDWYWAALPAGTDTLAVGLSSQRINSRPVMALLIALFGGLVLAAWLAVLLARRVVAPLAKLEEATARLGQGEAPDLLPEAGPTEIVALSRRFNTMVVQVRELLAARTTLLAGISHDLRTPLARMRLALELLRIKPEPALIERLENDIEQMDELIGNVLSLSRGLVREVPVSTAMEPLLQALAKEYSTPDRRIEVHCAPGVRLLPELALRRVLGNLLQNALRYAPEGVIELVYEQDELQGRVGVLDRGPGIPISQIEAMFQPFHRLEPSRSPMTGGQGLGLTIVRQLAQANGWRVSLSPRSGGGMQAWIDLPN